MTTEEVIARLEQMGLRGNLQSTGHPDYERIFILDKDKVSIGRVTIYKGKLQHVKWYVKKLRDLRGELLEDEKFVYIWNAFMECDRPPTEAEFDTALTLAKTRMRDRLDKLRAIRESFGKKKRKGLKGPNYRRYLGECLKEVMDDGDDAVIGRSS
jgi:hypothetical protein